MSSKTRDQGEMSGNPENTAAPFNRERLESVQSESEQVLLGQVSEVKSAIEKILTEPEDLKKIKVPFIGYLENESWKISERMKNGGSTQYLAALREFKTYIDQKISDLLSELTDAEKKQLPKPQSTGTGASNSNAYTLNRQRHNKSNTRWF